MVVLAEKKEKKENYEKRILKTLNCTVGSTTEPAVQLKKPTELPQWCHISYVCLHPSHMTPLAFTSIDYMLFNTGILFNTTQVEQKESLLSNTIIKCPYSDQPGG